jgi:hypothetical protein
MVFRTASLLRAKFTSPESLMGFVIHEDAQLELRAPSKLDAQHDKATARRVQPLEL